MARRVETTNRQEQLRTHVRHGLRALAHAYDLVADSWRARTYARAAAIVTAVDAQGRYIVRDLHEIRTVPGVGESVARAVNLLREGTSVADLLRRYERIPHAAQVEAYAALRKVMGIGHERARGLVRRGYHDVGTVRKHAAALGLNDFKTRFALDHYAELNTGISRPQARRIARDVIRAYTSSYADCIIRGRQSRAFPSEKDVSATIVGSYRRGKSSVQDVDLLFVVPDAAGGACRELQVCAANALSGAAHAHAQAGVGGVRRVLDVSNGPRRRTFIVRVDAAPGGKLHQVDVFCAMRSEEPTFLLHTTGGAEFNEYLREVAKRKGMLLNEYGLFRRTTPLQRIAVRSEAQVFSILGVPYVPPSERDTLPFSLPRPAQQRRGSR